jgi:hypothetical protein
LGDALKSQSVGIELLDERKNKEIKILDTNFSLNLNIEKQSRKDFEHEFQRDFDDKIEKMRIELLQNKKGKDSKLSSILSNIGNELSEAQGDLYGEKKLREEKFDMMIKKLGSDVLRIND